MDFAPGSTSALDRLTPRELQVAERVADGKSHKRVAKELGISPETVRAHVFGAARKLPGEGRPSFKIARYYFLLAASDSA